MRHKQRVRNAIEIEHGFDASRKGLVIIVNLRLLALAMPGEVNKHRPVAGVKRALTAHRVRLQVNPWM
jgi:hypothetical protein